MKNDPVRPKERFLVFGSPAIGEEEIEEVIASMKSGWLGTGPKVRRFESDFKSYKGVSHAVAVNSCTAALHLSILAANLKPGDEVITTPLTFCATVNSIIHAGATPVLADVDPLTLNIDPEQVRAKISPNTKALLPVHFAGRACDMDALSEIAQDNGLKIIEDCAHAIETEYRGRKTGTFGDFGCFSFYVTKNVVTGEGGMVLTRGEAEAARIKILALHGMSKDAWKRFDDEGYKHYYVMEAGFKYNMMDLQAAIGIHQLERVETNWIRRQEVWREYNSALAQLPIGLPTDPETDTRHAYHLYTIMINDKVTGINRDEFLEGMTRQNIGVGVHYMSVPEHPFYQNQYGWKPEDYPSAMTIGRQTVSLPLSAKLTGNDVSDVIEAVNRVFNKQ
ncbi:MAG: DegT/DnrJ/EryC1/StrS family aminotransferase [Candidatus Adiutricales bacterium]